MSGCRADHRHLEPPQHNHDMEHGHGQGTAAVDTSASKITN